MTAKRLEKPQPKRQPTPEQIDAFVKTGEGNDTAPLASVSTESQRSVPSKMSRLTVDLPTPTHRRFKIACAVAGTQMNNEIRQFIERRSRELEALGK